MPLAIRPRVDQDAHRLPASVCPISSSEPSTDATKGGSERHFSNTTLLEQARAIK